MPSVLDRKLLTDAAENLDLEGKRYWLRAQRWARGGPDREGGDEKAYDTWQKLRVVANVLRKYVMQAEEHTRLPSRR